MLLRPQVYGQEAGVTNSKDGELQKRLTETLSDSEEAEAYYKELIQNPSKSGVDLKSPVFLFSNEKVSLGYLLPCRMTRASSKPA